MNNEVTSVFNKLDAIAKDHNGRLINGANQSGFAYVHMQPYTNNTRARIQLSCAPYEYHNKASGRHVTGVYNGYRIDNIVACEDTGRSPTEVAADILADALTDVGTFLKFLETSPSDAYEDGVVPSANRSVGVNRMKIIKTDDRLVKEVGRSVLGQKHGKNIFLELAKTYGRDTVKQSMNSLTINEFELRFGL